MRRRRNWSPPPRRELAQRLAAQPKLFHSVTDLSGSEFFARNAWLFQSTADVERLTKGLGRGAPVISALAGDPSLRGLTKALSLALVGVQMHRVTLDDLAPPLSMAADTLDDVLDGRAGGLLLAGTAERQAGDAERAAALHRGSSGPELFSARAGAGLERGHPARRRRSRSCRARSGARAADRPGADGRPGIRHRPAWRR